MKEKVIVAKCEDYDAARIKGIILTGMEELNVIPQGRVLIKPNAVIAHRKYFRHAYTRPEFLDGLISAVKERSMKGSQLAVGERSGITIPTRFCFSQAGYNKVIRRHGVKRYFFDECNQVERCLKNKKRLRNTVFIPQPIDECDFLINVPKLKSHPWTRITIALKNYIGIQDDKHRLIDHDYLLEHKIADLQEIIQPGFIAVDAIVAGELKMLTPIPYPMGLVFMGTNPVAVDAAVCHLIGFDPRKVDHLRICHERGFGPIDIKDIKLIGKITRSEIRKKTAGFRVPIDTVDVELNEKSRLKAHVGRFPEPKKMPYCWGGCPGSLIEGMEIVKTMQPEVYKEVNPIHYIFGHVTGNIELKPGEKIVLCGDCARIETNIDGKKELHDSLYMDQRKKDVHHAKSKDLILRMFLFVGNFIIHGRKRIRRIRGCPVSVAENVLYLWKPGGTKNPYIDPLIVFPFAWAYIIFKIANISKIIFKRRSA